MDKGGKMTFYKRSVIFLMALLLVIPFIFPKEKKVRRYLTGIEWYPRYPDQLNRMLDTFFSNAKSKSIPGKIVGLIGPHAGLAYSGQCAARAYKQLKKSPGLERVIMLGVSHRGGFYGAAVSDFEYNSTPLGNIPVDTQVTAQLAKEKFFTINNNLLQNEHSLETHLPFLQYIQGKLKNNRYKIVPILFGYLKKEDFKPMAAIIKKYVTPKTLVIASSDFTHYGSGYGYIPFREKIKENLTKLDMGMADCIKKLDFDGFFQYKRDTGITMCGFIPVGIMMNIFVGENYTGTLIDYYKSADRSGDYSFSVSYVSIIISESKGMSKDKRRINRGPGKAPEEKEKTISNTGNKPMNLSNKEKKTLFSIARGTLEDHFAEKNTSSQTVEEKYKSSLTPLLKEKAGVFVTLKKSGELRGCIGTIVGVEPLWEGVRKNALNAAFNDYRFSSLKENELKKIEMEISVMTPLQKIDDYKKIRLGTDGVIIRKYGRQAVFLPQVATETGWGLDMFLGRLCMKAGLPFDAYKSEGMEFFIFQAMVFGEHDLALKNRKK
jgi:AmmeMemoRadiSam system protein B/AmmeMemoRadiSam system protein A